MQEESLQAGDRVRVQVSGADRLGMVVAQYPTGVLVRYLDGKTERVELSRIRTRSRIRLEFDRRRLP